MNWIMTQSLIVIAGLFISIMLVIFSVITKSTILIIVASIVSFIVGAAISELGQKGKDMGLIK